MSELDYEVVLQRLPAAIEAIQEQHLKKIPASVEIVNQAAKASGSPQFERDAKEWERVVGINTEYVTRICGQEGDTAADQGSLWGFVYACKQVKKAVGGDD